MPDDGVRQLVEATFPDRVLSIEQDGVWVSGMNANCASVARRIAGLLESEGYVVDMVRDDDAVRFGGRFVPVRGRAEDLVVA